MKAQVVKRMFAVLTIIAIFALTFSPITTVTAAVIFEDGFETGDFSKWTSVSDTPAPTITSGNAHTGTYKAVFDTTGQAAQIILPGGLVDHAFMRAYVMFKSFPAPGATSTVLGLFNTQSINPTTVFFADALIKNEGGTIKWALAYYDNDDDYTIVSDMETPVLDTWYSVEVEGKGNSTTDGESRIFINGKELTDVTRTGLNNPLKIKYGFLFAQSNVSRWYDDVVISGTSVPASPVITGAATNVSTTGATLNGSVNANGKDTTVTFEYGLTSSYGTTVTATPGSVSGSTVTAVSAAISGLTANTLYHYRVVGVNTDPATLYGSDATFTTATVLAVSGPASVTYGSPLNITTSGGSGTGALSYSASSSTGCTVNVSSGLITVTNASGTCTITATKAADATYSAQTSAGYSVTLNKRPVTLSGTRAYNGLTTVAYGVLSISNKVGTDDVAVASGNCTLENANVGTRGITSFGTLALSGTAAGNYTLIGATGSVVITKANQAAVIVTGPASVTYGSPVSITTSGGSGTGALSYSAGSSTGCTVNASSGEITVTDASGTCTVTATKAADTNYNAITSAAHSVMLTKADQAALIVTGPSKITIGSTEIIIITSGGSGTGTLTYSAGSSTGCTVNASSGHITVTDLSGICKITVTKAADTNYNAATSAEYSVNLEPIRIFMPSIFLTK